MSTPDNSKPTGKPQCSSSFMSVAEIEDVRKLVEKYKAQGLITITPGVSDEQLKRYGHKAVTEKTNSPQVQ